ncbi:glycerate kinase [Lactobacillus amylovorus]|jgi:glycerate kinase|uniref:Glycerate kinase n=1 Tax=Lactobacillus amylovorus TaxID=1604 RepID=A0AAW6B9K1_LACAM|nr:glycerate kinase [Lactobacillus amylovorus]ATO53732.1 glycerate kinase [Lactobacillus amylovorus DSM 20531]KRK41096.1 glycerate kinase [Lactobacillus amylovorus DSM 20531]MCT3585970.1 glycerate kinase [Lactobacillus amylovorus]MCT3593147.1 glycerate kinase [Lactobacillus amylovorus]MDA6089152.1 glycerate kinase [Lactobacillus amylovorus]
MKFVLASDSFKESMTAKEVCQAMENGIRKVLPDAKIISVPMADGGEGTMDSLIDATNGQKYAVKVTEPLGTPVTAHYGILGDQKTAIIEMAEASGLSYVPQDKRTPATIKKTTTFGTGELINAALKHDVTRVIIGLGGSSTNDGGSGMAQAIGVKFFDHNDHEITQKLGGGDLKQITRIDTIDINPKIKKTKFLLASDVTNPLTGTNGASYVFGPQKGADQATAKELDENLSHYAKIIGQNIAQTPGSGAAGGLGAGLLAFTHAKIYPGVKLVANEVHLAEKIKEADYVFTGEGGTDFQTQFGKTPYGVAQIAKKYDVPVISLAGYIGKGIDHLYDKGFTAIFGILAKAENIDQALKDGPQNVERTTENVVRLIAKK